MDDLVKRLTDGSGDSTYENLLRKEAADEIARLQADLAAARKENERLEGVLQAAGTMAAERKRWPEEPVKRKPSNSRQEEGSIQYDRETGEYIGSDPALVGMNIPKYLGIAKTIRLIEKAEQLVLKEALKWVGNNRGYNDGKLFDAIEALAAAKARTDG